MPNPPLEANVRKNNNVAIIDLKGEIDSFADAALNEAYAQASQTKPTRIILNFKNVDYINSTGIALIVGLMAQSRKAGIKFIATCLSEHYVEIFKITRLSDFMGIFSDESAALASA